MHTKFKISFVVAFISAANLFAQQNSVIDKYAASIKPEDAKRHLTILAADWMEGRETGERGQKMAAAYIADQFKSFGLKQVVKEAGADTYYQKFDLEKRAWKNVSIKLDTAKLKFLDDFYLYGDFDIPTEEKSELVFVGYGIDAPNYSDYKLADGKFHTNVKGKTVVLFSGEPSKDSISLVTKSKAASVWANDWRKKASAAKELGAKNVIVIIGSVDNDYTNRLNQI